MTVSSWGAARLDWDPRDSSSSVSQDRFGREAAGESLPTAGRIPATWGSPRQSRLALSTRIVRVLSHGLTLHCESNCSRLAHDRSTGPIHCRSTEWGCKGLRVEAFELRAPPPGHEALRTLFAMNCKRGRPAALPFVVLVVPSNLKNRLRTHLETTYSRSHATLFPDLAGYAAFRGPQSRCCRRMGRRSAVHRPRRVRTGCTRAREVGIGDLGPLAQPRVRSSPSWSTVGTVRRVDSTVAGERSMMRTGPRRCITRCSGTVAVAERVVTCP